MGYNESVKRQRKGIYVSKAHLIFTFLVIVAPFLFLLAFSSLSGISAAKMFSDVGISIFRLLIAYVISAVLAWTLAVSFYRGRRSLVALPTFDVMQSFPTFATLPLAVTFFGASNATIIIFLVITMIWPILFSVISSMKLIKSEWSEAVAISKLSRWNYLTKFLWPVSAPALVTGSIIGVGEGWEAVVATEIIVGSQSGLGAFFGKFSENPTTTALGILALLIIIFSLGKLIWMPLLEKTHKRLEE